MLSRALRPLSRQSRSGLLLSVALVGGVTLLSSSPFGPSAVEESKFLSAFLLPSSLFLRSSVALCDAAASPSSKLDGGKESSTGIHFPALVDGLTYVGSGVRVKYGFVKVYAVGAYVDPSSMSKLKGKSVDEVNDALLSPSVPKTIRIVMNRSLSVDKYMAAINEALLPRMKGVDVDKLDEFKLLNPPGELAQGAEMVMSLRGDTMMYRSSAGAVGSIKSETFVRALADVYFGKDAVSPPLRAAVKAGVDAL